MRRHHAITIVAAILTGFGIKLFFFSGQAAEANMQSTLQVSFIQTQDDPGVIKNLPMQEMHDMSFVFSDRD